MEMCRNEIISEDYRDFIVSGADEFSPEECGQDINEFYQIIYKPANEADPIAFDRFDYYSIPKCFALLDMAAMQQSGILTVQNYPNLELSGSGVMIGFVDTGIDYQNNLFRNLDGSTRIESIWDQTIQDGLPPEGFCYGTEYGKEVIDEALRGEEPQNIVASRDDVGHGTFLASLAAGGADTEAQFVGAAPESKLVVVKLKPAKQYLKKFYAIKDDALCYQENDIMLGIDYLHKKAEGLGLPLVICLALGTNMGSHSGSSPLAGILDFYGNLPNRAVVVGAGNEANQRHHYLGENITAGENAQVEVRVEREMNGFYMELWSDALDLFEVSVTSPSGENTYQFPIRNRTTQRYTFVLERTILTVDYKVFVEGLNAELIVFRMENPTPGIWRFQVEPVQTVSGKFHMWLPITEFLEGEVYFLTSNPDYTITEPGNFFSGITAGFYNGNDNSVAIPSGRGYTRNERVKPDFVAPGVNVKGAIGQMRYASRSGSSIATAIASGAAALMMEWVVYRLQDSRIDSTQIRNLLVLGTEKRPGEQYPNREWGYGTLDVYHTFEVISQI